jgi:hypothetical protein
MESWQQLLHQVEEIAPVAASAFITGRLLSWSDDALVLGYPPGSFELQRAHDRDKQRIFEEECSKLLGRKLTIQVREITSSEEDSPEARRMSAIEDRERKKAERSQRLREEAETHPVTRAFVDKFGAVIDSITTEADES